VSVSRLKNFSYDGQIDLEPETIDRVLERMRPAYEALGRLGPSATPEQLLDAARALVAYPNSKLEGPAVVDLQTAHSDLVAEIRDFREGHRSDRGELQQELEWAKEDFGIAADFVKRAAAEPGSVDIESLQEAVDDSTRRLDAAHAALAEFSDAWTPEALRQFQAQVAPLRERFDQAASSLIWQLEASMPSPMTRKINEAWDGASRVARELIDTLRTPHDDAR
jgi:hypothetical protein